MPDTFEDLPTNPGSGHDPFQSWRASNPTGFVLNIRSSADIMIHRTGCTHFGDVQWRCSPDGSNSLTNRKKVCSDSAQELSDYAREVYSADAAICGTCKPTLQERSSADDEWADEELRAAVQAYEQMRQSLAVGRKFNKAQSYRDLGARFRRSPKAFEFRMCNISYVLSLQGRAWLPGLLPRSNVGSNVASRIEFLLAETEGRDYGPVAEFEVKVRKELKHKIVEAPPGNESPRPIPTTRTQFERDPAVKAWVLKNAEGACECCMEPAPFVDNDGIPYLEVHHVTRLADNGADKVTNAIAVCPNCHRRLHHGREAADLVQKLKKRLGRLI